MSNKNHTFTCATCKREWIILVDQLFECVFVGLCYECIEKTGLTSEDISRKLRELAVDERFAEELASRQ